MENKKTKKISLSTHAMWTALYWTVLLFTQLIMIYLNTSLSDPLYLGPIYIPLLLDIIVLVLVISVYVIYRKKSKQREKSDELSNLNEATAGQITKYILVFVFGAMVFLIQDFRPFYTDDVFGNFMRTFLVFLSISEIIHNIVFFILEKQNLE